MSTRAKFLLGFGIYIAITIAVFLIFGNDGKNDSFQPQNEFKLETWVQITIFGIDFGTLLAGTIFTEKIFDIDGIGLWSLQAVAQRDLPVVAATALFGAAVLIISNIVVDVIYSVLDPRVRLS